MSTYSILLLDDQPEVRRVLRTGIESMGSQYKVIDLPSAEEAILVLYSQKFDLLITDVRLPGISGLELMERVRKRNPHLKVILITGLTDQRVRRQVSAVGASAFFIKPIILGDFLDAVQAALTAPAALPDEPSASEPPASEAPKPPEQPAKLTQPEPERTPSRIRSRYKAEPEQAPQSAADSAQPDALASLRKEMGAQAIAVLGPAGTIAAQSGELPIAIFGAGLAEKLAVAAQASAAIQQAFNTEAPQNLLFFNGPAFNLLLAYLDPTRSLLVVTTRSTNQLTNAAASIHEARPALRALLERLVPEIPEQPAGSQSLLEALAGLSASPAPPPEQQHASDIPEVEITEEDIQSVEELFKQASAQTANAGHFWDSLVEDTSLDGNLATGALSYEEARRLGIAPSED